MIYESFIQEFLPKFLKIQSFRGKQKFADQNLERIGSGSGRVVYDIDGTKVFKLAKNTKGIAQNEVEANIGKYNDVNDIVTIVYESADDDSWLIAEKAKKVGDLKIIKLTDIPNLSQLFYYLRNWESSNHGRGDIFHQEPEIKEKLDNNEFVQTLVNFIANYDQKVGDMGRPSTYGEVMRDGQPTIVLTDYGLNDEVYNTHYSPKRANRIYELYNFADGNDDMLSDIGNTWEVRRGMWALMPYGVGDGKGVINEEFVHFVSNRDYYPSRPLPSMPYMVENFHECVNNLKNILKETKNKKQFYSNLLKLQEYLIKQNVYDREPLELFENKEKTINEEYDRNTADDIANKVAEKLGLRQPKFLGSGNFGVAYDIGNNLVLKITSDKSEAYENMSLIGKPLKYVAKPYKVFTIRSESKQINETFAIILEKLETDPIKFNALFKRLDFVFEKIIGVSFMEVFETYIGMFQTDFDVDKVDKYLIKNPIDGEFFYSLVRIAEELKKYRIQSIDYLNPRNLGYTKKGAVGFFDVGFGNTQFKPTPELNIAEDGTAKFSTQNAIGQDNFPAYETNDTSPSIENDLDANSAMYNEDLEYSHASDATQDEYTIDERQISAMKGSSTVNVKKKCRLGGLGNTSAACNQGDIGNLNIKPLNETSDEEYNFYELMGDMVWEVFLSIKNKKKIRFNLINPNQYKTALNEYIKYGEFLRFPTKIIQNWKSLVLHNIALLNILNEIFGHSDTFPFEEFYDVFEIPKEEQDYNFDKAYEILDNQYDIDSYVPVFSNGAIVMSDYGIEPLFKLAKELLNQNTPEEIIVTINKILDVAHQRSDLAELFIKGGSVAQYSISNNEEEKENEVIEGVGDKYVEKFGVEPEFKDFEDKFGRMQNIENKEDIVYNDGHYSIIRNPKSLKNIKANVRGVIDNKGNLYVEQHPKEIHNGILRILFKLGLVEKNVYNWRINLPENFITVQRYKDTNRFVVGESNTVMLPNEYRNDDWWKEVPSYVDARKAFQEYFDRAKIKNPNIDFINKNIYIYSQSPTFDSVIEGVGDKYAEKRYNMEPEFSDFENKYGEMKSREDKNKIIFDNGSLMIIKNPKSLENIGAYVRGIIDKEGNLYIQQQNSYMGGYVHDDILEVLEDLKLVKNDKNWHKILPTEFITVQRYIDTNRFLLGESYIMFVPKDDRPHPISWSNVPFPEEVLPITQQFLDKAKRKNPNIDFINMRILDYQKNLIRKISEETNHVPFEKQIQKDLLTHKLDKTLIEKYNDINENVNIYAVNGDEVRDGGFIEWVDGGHHYVDAYLSKNEQKYAKNIPENEIWIDDVFLSKPNDMAAIILHEKLERYLMKHFGMKYDTAHADYANKAESIFRKKVENGMGKEIANKIFNAIIKKYVEKHPNKHEIKENKEPPIKYGCLMLYLNISNWNKITSMINPNDIYDEIGYGIEKEPHLTILYGFHDNVTYNDVFNLYKENAELSPIRVNINRISVFENPDFDVVKFDVSSNVLSKMNDIMKKLPHTSNFPEYHPHITIAYVKKGTGEKYKKQFEKNKTIVGDNLVFSYKGDDGAKNKKTLSLNQNNVEEGIGDVYAEKKWGIPNDDTTLNKQMTLRGQENLGEPVAYVQSVGKKDKKIPIFKNPKSLTNFEKEVRAISDSTGNLFVAQEDGSFSHGSMSSALNLYKYDSSVGWNRIYSNLDRFVLLQRIKETNSFGLSDSSDNFSNDDPEAYYAIIHLLKAAKKKNPQFDFYVNYYETTRPDSMKIEENENNFTVNNIAYSAIVLDEESHNKLIKVFDKMIPRGWELLAHHSTLNMGKIDPKYEQDLDKQIELSVVDYAIDDKVMAVGVEGYGTNNAKAHITIAVNRQEGGKPFMSNKLTNWKPIGFPLKLSGTITEVKRIIENIAIK